MLIDHFHKRTVMTECYMNALVMLDLFCNSRVTQTVA